MFRIHMLPAEDGDCFLVETGTAPHRILIDGGRNATATAYLATLLCELPRRPGPLIDLMVLTHVDADHIEGLLTMIPKMSKLDVGEIWFNGLQHVRIADGQKPPSKTVAVDARMRPAVPVLSIRQGQDLTGAVEALGWCWNGSLPGGVAMVEPGGPLPAIPLSSGGRITLLGPPRAKLGAFAREWEFWFAKLGQRTPALGGGGQTAPTLTSLAAFAKSRDTPDTAKPNGTSITFVVEHGGKRALFCADAHPDDLASSVAHYDGEGRVYFDAIKVAHHGSAANNTSALIDRLASPLWLISSNGSRHGHPDPEAIARIVLAPCPDKQIVFNYQTGFNRAWGEPDLAKSARYRPLFPTVDRPTIVDLL
ncbi:hypothetical protein [Mesorhizobium sp. B2-4-17]|uniref:ComEC/Rec2 family competence protein n=1 Tax=Mesorhizobium sp. B2-4-17 TaxID=2589932 RepID=UPI00112A99DE|nr:hypothetical protein [Mesorhizobium sp. B2-4-17]TPK87361.1 hypothetical protein FJ548_14280 [Mesorhizobium sp. B2-4-17]